MTARELQSTIGVLAAARPLFREQLAFGNVHPIALIKGPRWVDVELEAIN